MVGNRGRPIVTKCSGAVELHALAVILAHNLPSL